jgi:hypothetical protein
MSDSDTTEFEQKIAQELVNQAIAWLATVPCPPASCSEAFVTFRYDDGQCLMIALSRTQ